MFNSCVITALTYGYQMWTLSKQLIKKLQSTQNTLERAMLGIELKQKIRLKKIKAKFKFNKNILHFIRRLKWDWAGHLGRLKDDHWTTKITF